MTTELPDTHRSADATGPLALKSNEGLGVTAGAQYGRLVLVERASGPGKARWKCSCECGASIIARQDFLKCGKTRSCGCFHRDRVAQTARERQLSHGKTVYGDVRGFASIWLAWSKVKRLCVVGWKGGGHRVCHEYDPRWSDFAEFYKDFGDIKADQTISRRDNQLPWSKENCFVNQGRRTAKKLGLTPNVRAKLPAEAGTVSPG
jgi:hypothetical protein